MTVARHPWLAKAAALGLVAVFARNTAAQEAQDSSARNAMRDYQTECNADGGALWGRSLCGPIILVQPETRRGVASMRPPGGNFQLDQGVWVGTVPSGIPLSNTSLVWAGTPWAFVRLPMAGARVDRLSTLLHESFHRIEDSLRLQGGDPMLPHLDERDGRYWLRLQIRAMSAALASTGAAARAATRDALVFRARRAELYPGTDTLEDLVERHEGMAEYTGAVLALRLTGESVASTSRLFSQFETRPTFVRSLGYGTGPALGLLLDRYAPGWRHHVAGRSPAGLLGAAMKYAPGKLLDREASIAALRYDGATIGREEDEREHARQGRLAEYRRRLVDGPVLELRQDFLGRSFNPNTLIAFGELGTIYPTGDFSAPWGSLTVDSAGALVSADFHLVRVALPMDTTGSRLKGDGWSLELKQGWRPVKGKRTGDLMVGTDSARKP